MTPAPFGGAGGQDDGAGGQDDGTGGQDDGTGGQDDGTGGQDDGTGGQDDGTGAEDRAGRRRGGRRPAAEPPGSGAAAVDREPDAEQVARTIALRLLTSAPRSRAQLTEAMARKDVPQDVADRVLDRFEEVGLVDDAEYAAMLVRTRHGERGLARRALAQELMRKGIDKDTARQALDAVTGEDEDAAARELVRRRAPGTARLPRETRVRRLVAMLGRKGHAPGTAYRIVTEELAALGDPEAADPDP